MKKNLHISFLLTMLLLTIFSTVVSAAEPEQYMGLGENRRLALLDAQRQALEGHGILLYSETNVEDYSVVNDRVYSKAGGYLESYRILFEKVENNEYVVVITDVVFGNKFSNKASTLQKKMNVDVNLGNPRIGLAIYGTSGGNSISGRSVFVKEFKKAGFQIYDTEQMNRAMAKTAEVAMNINDMALLENLSQLGVDYLCRVRVIDTNTRRTKSGNNVGSAEVYGEVLDTHTGQLVASSQKSQGGGLFSAFTNWDRNSSGARLKAEKNAMKNVAEDLAKQMSELAASVSNTIEVNMTASYNEFGSAEEARAWLESLPGVQAVFVRSSYYGSIILDVQYSGTASDLVDVITRRGKEAMFSNNKIIM